MVKWGVIGACGIAKRRTIPEGIVPAKNAELVAVMDVDEKAVIEAAQKFGGVKYYTKEDDLLKNPDVDAVYIATPVCLHASQVIKAANAKKHIFCEKQMAMTVADCEKMIKVCKKNKVKLSLGYLMRYNVYHKEIKEMLNKGLLGTPVMARAQLSCWYPEIAGAWRQEPAKGGGGSLIDMGTHCIDLLEMFFGKTKAVSCFLTNRAFKYPVEDTAIVNLEFQNGVIGIVDNCFSIPDASSKNRLEIYGTKGSILAEGTIGQAPGGEVSAYLEKEAKGYTAEQARTTSTEEKITLTPVNTYQAEIEDFSSCIEEDREPSFTGEHGLWNQKIVLACYESARKRKAISVG
ncbi:MAG: Gfo/Idh/MocA family oxidoreductase [Candidatus Omnitrophica bacterium]|nr:Gfo/Idh/MocA family oxidoreductase [Candidatus Omnitrophota bacterium]